MNRKAGRGRHVRGMSLAELLVGSALSMIVIGGVYSFYTAQTQALAAQRAYARSQDVTRTVIDLLGRELRMATYDPAGTAITTSPPGSGPGVKQGLLVGKLDEIQFVQDLNGDGDVTDTGEDVKYALSGNTIQRTDVDGTPLTLVTGVPNVGLTFRYFSLGNPTPVEYVPSGNPAVLSLGQRNCVAKVVVQVMSSLPNPDPYSSQPLESEVRTEVALRNRSLMNF